MSNTRSRSGMLVGLAAAVGAFGAASMMSAATAPTARADDFSEIVSAVEGDYADGQSAFTTAFADFSSNHLESGLISLFDGVNDDALSAPDNVLIGSVEALTNESIDGAIPWGFTPVASFSDGLSAAESVFSSGELYVTTDVAAALSGGDYGAAAYDELIGLDLLTVAPLQEVLLGVAASF